MNFTTESLAKRVTGSRVAEDAQGNVVGAVGLQIAERQGKIHSEGFTDFGVADQLRPVFSGSAAFRGDQSRAAATLDRGEAPFWTHSGLVKPDADALEKLPASWRHPSADWLTRKTQG